MDFVPFLVTGLLLLASGASVLIVLIGFVLRRQLRGWVERFVPAAAPALQHSALLVGVPLLGLLLVTGSCVKRIHQEFFLNEPMAIAASEGNLAEVRRLLDRGASPDSWGVDGIETALVGAADSGHVEIVRLLLERGADPKITDSNGQSALDHARQATHDDIVRLLEERLRR